MVVRAGSQEKSTENLTEHKALEIQLQDALKWNSTFSLGLMWLEVLSLKKEKKREYNVQGINFLNSTLQLTQWI